MAIDALLFDADGVVQTTSPDFRTTLAAAVGEGERVDEFIAEVLILERQSLVGRGDFRDDLQQLLRRRNVAQSVDQLLRAWSMIAPVPGVLELVAELRARQFPCFLASNQQRYRARHMSHGLGYAKAFTGEFYSHALGAMKPDPAFFRGILRELDLDPSCLLFLDDHEPNVAAACELGIQGVRFDAREHVQPSAAIRVLLAGHGVG